MGSPHRKKSAAEKALIERIRTITATLPEVDVEVDGFGHTSFRVANKPFLIAGGHEDGRASLAIKADHTTQEALIKGGRYSRTPYIGQHGWVSHGDNLEYDWSEIEELVADAYRRVAPKRLTRKRPPTVSP